MPWRGPSTAASTRLSELARRLIEQVSRPYMIEGHRVTIGASVGIAVGVVRVERLLVRLAADG